MASLEKTPSSRSVIDGLRRRPHADVIVIGGGINGIATFRDLALQGVDVVLVERGDFVSGASSASSHMVHGGVRYLENGEFRLVKEAVTERNDLLKTAPHFVKPLPTTIPIFRTFAGVLKAPFRLLVTHGTGAPSERGALLIKIGLVIYDTFSRGGGTVPRHVFQRRRRSLEQFPHLNKNVAYTATYFDASMHDPERLALDVLYDGVRAGGDRARAANYAEAVAAAEDGTVTVLDKVSGEEFDLTARVVVNTTGPWTDITNDSLGKPTAFMGGTKGSHIVLDNPQLLEATRGHEIFFEHSDGRIVLVYPIKGRVMVGTTDIDADPRELAVCTDDEIDYFFDLIKHVFPDVPVDRSQIVYSFSGIRPLPRHDDVAPGFVSRDYRIERAHLGQIPLLSLVGGKWTTFRALGEHLSGMVLDELGQTRTVSTRSLRIGGGKDYPLSDAARRSWIIARAGGHPHELVDRMLERYGTHAEDVLQVIPVGAAELAHVPGYFAEELAHLAGTEQVVNLTDLLLRRTSIAFVGGLSSQALTEIAAAVAPTLRWSPAETDRQIADVSRVIRNEHRIHIDSQEVSAFS